MGRDKGKVKRVALYQESANVNEVGGGGAQRFYFNIFEKFHGLPPEEVGATKLFFFSYNDNVNLNGNFSQLPTRAIKHLKFIPRINNRFKSQIENLIFFFLIFWYRIDIVHITHYFHVPHYSLIGFINKLPKWVRPKVAITFMHCEFPYSYVDEQHHFHDVFHERFDPLFKEVQLDGIFSYYSLFKEFVKQQGIVNEKVLVRSINHYCCNVEKFTPLNKENQIIFAARFNKIKCPLMFIEAVKHLRDQRPDLLDNWKFIMCGNGFLEKDIHAYISQHGLDFVELHHSVSDMSAFFGKSKVFVSTQSFENFTSLSMNEAMAAGNAIISRDVGQTNLYLKEGENGFFAKEDSPKGIAEAILRYCDLDDENKETLQDKSLQLIKEVHNFDNFMEELDAFWNDLLER